MSASFPKKPDQITAEWLSIALSGRDSHSVRVSSVDIQICTKWNVAETAFLKITYESSVRELPTGLFVKITETPDPLSSIFPGEKEFYTANQYLNLPIARCLATLCDRKSGAVCIILEDLSASHEVSLWPLPPTLARCLMAVRSLAEVHAHWRQETSSELYRRENSINELVAEMLPNFLADMGDRLSVDRAELLSQVCLRIPGLKAERYRSASPVTRIHGDAHLWNVLYPKDPNSDRAILIDFEDWRVDFAGLDLAMMFALHWYPKRRALHEVAMLTEYLGAYNSQISSAMCWEELWHDYRIGHICNAIIPIFQHAAGNEHASWWSNLERWFMAFDDLRCEELL